MSLDDELRVALRSGDDAKAIRLQARLGHVADPKHAAAANFQWKALDGRVLQLHQISDDHLEGIIKLKIRRFVRVYREQSGGLIGPRGRRLDDVEIVSLVFSQFMGWSKVPVLVGECTRRKMPREKWRSYLIAVIERRCEDCGERRKPPSLVFERGPADRLQCPSCAKKCELRCSKCDKPNGGELGSGRNVRGLGVGNERTLTYRSARCQDPECRSLLAWVKIKRRAKATGTPRQRHSRDGQLRCDLCAPLRCSKAP